MTITLPEPSHYTYVVVIQRGTGQVWEQIKTKNDNNCEVTFSLNTLPKCDCGAKAVNSDKHSHWCSVADKL